MIICLSFLQNTLNISSERQYLLCRLYTQLHYNTFFVTLIHPLVIVFHSTSSLQQIITPSLFFSFNKTEQLRSFEIARSCTLYTVSEHISPQKTVTPCQSLQFPHITHHSYQNGITTSKQKLSSLCHNRGCQVNFMTTRS